MQPIIGSFYRRYYPINGKVFTQGGKKFQVIYSETRAAYPYPHYLIKLELKNLSTESQYKFIDLTQGDSFEQYSKKLEKLLISSSEAKASRP